MNGLKISVKRSEAVLTKEAAETRDICQMIKVVINDLRNNSAAGSRHKMYTTCYVVGDSGAALRNAAVYGASHLTLIISLTCTASG